MTDQEKRVVDAWIARNIMEWFPADRRVQGWGEGLPVWFTGNPDNPTYQDFRPTEESNQAMAVLKKCAEKLGTAYTMAVGETPTGWSVESTDISAESETLELAIALFARKLFDQTPQKA